MDKRIIELGRKLLSPYRCGKCGGMVELRPIPTTDLHNMHWRIFCSTHGSVRFVKVSNEALQFAAALGVDALAKVMADRLVQAVLANAEDGVEWNDLRKTS